MRLRDKQYYPDDNIDRGFFSRHVILDNPKDDFKNKTIIGLPRSFHTDNGRHIDAAFVYSLLGLTIADNSKEREIAVVLPDGWYLVKDNHYGYWSVLCNEHDQVVFDLFIKQVFWLVEDMFVRFSNDTDEENLTDIIYSHMCCCCIKEKQCHDDCVTCSNFDNELDKVLKFFSESKEVSL